MRFIAKLITKVVHIYQSGCKDEVTTVPLKFSITFMKHDAIGT